MDKKSLIFFDVETIPLEPERREWYIEYIRQRLLKKGRGEELIKGDELYLNTAFDGTLGRIACVSYMIDQSGKTVEKDSLTGSESEILQRFWSACKNVDKFVGHNIFQFDLPFLFQRSVIHGVKPIKINMAKFRSDPVFDTMYEWNSWNSDKPKGLDLLANVLKLPTSKDEMDGSGVWRAYKEGRIEDIARYCMKDVELTRKIYYKMNFEEV